MKIKFALLLLVCWITVVDASTIPHDNNFRTVDSRTGLSQTNVKSITQDDFGFIWLGTKNGLCRYDGRTIRTFFVSDATTGMGNQNISALEAEQGHLMWVGTDEGLFLYDCSLERFCHIDTQAQDGQRMTNWVANIQHDRQGNVWVTIPEEGVFRIECDGRTGFHDIVNAPIHHFPNPGRSNDSHFTCLCITTRNEVWASGWNIGLWRLNPTNDRFEQLTHDAMGHSLLGIQTNTLTQLPDGRLAMAVQDGHLMLYSPLKGELAENPWHDFSSTLVRGATAYGAQLLVGTYNGLYSIQTTSGEVLHYRHNRNNTRSLSDDIIYTTFRDTEGGYWVGTMFGGVSYLPPREQMFAIVETDRRGNSLSSDRIRQMATDGAQNLWLCTEDGGINHINLDSGDITTGIGRLSGQNDDFTTCLCYYQGRLYSGINKTGVKIIDTRTGQAHIAMNAQMGLPKETTVYGISVDPRGGFWLATDHGAWRGDSQFSTPLQRVKGMEDAWVYDILHDRNGRVWMALMGSGLARMDKPEGPIRYYQHDAKNDHSLSSGSVSAVFEDSKGRIWLSTDRGGICRYQPKTDDFVRYSTEEGLPDNVAYNILEDSHGRLWFGTNRGLAQLNPETGHVHVFTTQQGLPSNQFNYKSALSLSDGTMFFGTINGLVYCQSEGNAAKSVGNKTSDAGEGRLFITRISIDGQDLSPAQKNSLLKQSIMETERITLPNKHANLNLNVAQLSYATGLETIYEYRLEPIDREWHSVPEGGLSLASLASGTYTLRLRSSYLSTENAPQGTCTLVIVVRPPIWRQWWAIMLYIVALASLVTLWATWYRRRKESQFAEQQRIFTMEKEKELSEKRIQYFTEIAHEIRTPLTLINGPLEVIEKKGVEDNFLARNLKVIHQNTNRLLNLASQLLDFQKVDSGEMRPQLETVNVSELLKGTMERFEPTYNIQGKALIGKQIETAVLAQIDREAVTKILSNLLNNALKYGQSRCEVELTTNEEQFRLAVFSDGNPIPEAERETIFSPFVQLKGRKRDGEDTPGGVGIGLALCRSLAKMQGGTLSVEAGEGGNTFVLALPLGEPTITEDEHNPTALPSNTTLRDDGLLTQDRVRGANILLVEDEEGIRNFITERLREDFIVSNAENGQQALEKLRANHFDLVITDIMMPVMDGIELCRNIKQDIELSHIPVIFLTAKNDTGSKIAGLEVGAEAYIEKPFAWDFLRMQIASLLSNRQKEREAFAKRPFFPMNGMQMSREDEDFMNRTLEVINEHLSDESFNVEAMASALCMSRSSLLRKIKTLFDMPPLDFIRLIRLKKAADLIQEGRYRMGEIGLMVGFSNHSYFSKLFCRQFGMTPKDFEKKIQEQREKAKTLRQE